jgi:hypothetical protein
MNAKVRAWPDFNRSLGLSELLILSGPSASGKTTFVRALYGGGLAEDIQALLPAAMRRAPSVDIKFPTKVLINSMLQVDSAGTAISYSAENGCVLHYALNRLKSLKIGRLEDDLPLVEVVDSTRGAITIVIVQVDRKRLAAQYATRMFRSEAGDGTAGIEKLVGYGRRLARGLDIGKLSQLALDRYSDNVERLYGRWDRLASEIVERRRNAGKARVRIIRVEPGLQVDSGQGFRLLSFADCQG